MLSRAESNQKKNLDRNTEREIGLTPESELIRGWSGSDWEIALEKSALSIKIGEKVEKFPFDGTIRLHTKRRWFRWYLLVESEPKLRLKGLSRVEAKLLEISFELSQARLWSMKLQKVLAEHHAQQRWIPQELIDDLIDNKPKFTNQKTIQRLNLSSRFNEYEIQALIDLNLNLTSMFDEKNQNILHAELKAQKQFLANIEKKTTFLGTSYCGYNF